MILQPHFSIPNLYADMQFSTLNSSSHKRELTNLRAIVFKSELHRENKESAVYELNCSCSVDFRRSIK